MASSMEIHDVSKTSTKSPNSKKRKTSESTDTSNTKERKKKKKEDKLIFSEVEFKVMLRDPNTAFSGLDKFLIQSESFREGESKFDIVEAYCRSSPDCIEIFNLLEAGKRKTSELFSIISVLESILVHLADGVPRLQPVAVTIARRILSQHLGAVYALLNMKNKSGQIKVTLRLLSAIVMQGAEMARLVIMQFDLTHYTIAPLLQRRDAKDSQDVRTCLLQFMMAFLIVGDNTTIKQLVETKGFLNGMFAGMISDKLSTLQMVLPTLKEKIAENGSVSKTSKVRLFNTSNLQALSKLYQWRGPTSWTQHKNRKQDIPLSEELPSDVSPEELEMIQQLVHDLLLELTCPFKTGINFYDKTLGTSQKNMNHMLTNLLSALDRPYADPLKCQLVTNVLKACPDQLVWYLPSLKHTLAPRPSVNWIQAMDFLQQIYEHQDVSSAALELPDKVSLGAMSKMLLASLVPPRDVWLQVTKALQDSHRTVQCRALTFMQLVLSRIIATNQAFGQAHQHYTSDQLGILRENLQDSLVKLLPSVGVLMKQWVAVSEAIGAESENTAPTVPEITQTPSKEGKTEENSPAAPMVPVTSHLLALLRVLCAYQEALPALFTSQPLNLGPLVEAVLKLQQQQHQNSSDDDAMMSEAADSNDRRDAAMLQLQLLKLLAASSSQQVAWLKESVGGRTTVSLLLEMTLSTHGNDQLYNCACHLLAKLLGSTSIFEHCQSEVGIWLHKLACVKWKSRANVTAFLEKCLVTLIKSPYRATDKVAELVAEAASLESSHTVMDNASNATQDNLVESILSLEDEDLAMAEDSSGETIVSITDDIQFPFSCLVPASLDAAEGTTMKGVKEYIEAVLLEIFTQQNDPRALCLLMQQKQSVVGPHLAGLANAWLPKKIQMVVEDAAVISADECMDQSLLTLLQYCLRGQLEVSDAQVSGLLIQAASCVNPLQAEKTVQHGLLCIKKQMQLGKKIGSKACGVLGSHLGLLEAILANLTKSQSEPDTEVLLDKEFASLLPKPVGKLELLNRIYCLIFTDSALQDMFLWHTSSDASSKESKHLNAVSVVVTEHMSKILAAVPVDVLYTFKDSLQGYTIKLLDHLAGVRTDHASVFNASFLHAAEGLMGCLSSRQLHQMVELLLVAPTSAFMIGSSDLTAAGNVLILTLTQFVNTLSVNNEVYLSPTVLQCIAELCMGSHSDRLADVVRALLKRQPINCMAFSQDFLIHCLSAGNDSKAKLACVVIQESTACRQWLREWVPKNKALKNKQFRHTYISAVLASLEDGDAAWMGTVQKRYWSDLNAFAVDSSVCENADEAQWTLLNCLIPAVAYEPAEVLWSQLCHTLKTEKQFVQPQLQLLCKLTEHLASSKGRSRGHVHEEYLVCLLRGLCFQAQNKGKQDRKDWIIEKIQDCLQSQTLGKKAVKDQIDQDWSNILKHCLKVLIRTPKFLDALRLLSSLIFSMSEADSGNEGVCQMYQMLMSHSAFLDIMLGDASPQKASLVELLLCLVKLAPGCCSSSHAGILLGAYQASLQKTDQQLLLLLREYEKSGCSLAEFSPYLWGPTAAEQHALRKSLGPSLSKRPSTQEVLEALDKDKLLKSALHFPLTRTLQDDDVYSSPTLDNPNEVYDPAFLLPLFSQLLGPEMLINCRQFIQSQCLSYVCASLSSHDLAIRGAAYHVLNSFQTHLEGARFAEKTQITYLLECLQNSVEKPGSKLAPIIGIYMSLSVELLLQPRLHMYQLLNSFILLKPSLDVHNVPDFFKLFNSSAQEFHVERGWVLSLLESGLRETADYRIMEKRFAFKLLLSFYDCSLCDRDSQILRIVHRACKLKTVGFDLVKHHGLLPWLSQVITACSTDAMKTVVLVDIVNDLWLSQLGNRDQADTTNKERPCLPVLFSNEMLQLALLIATNARPPIPNFLKYSRCLLSILVHLKKTSNLAGDRRATIIAVHLPLEHVLLLLWHWAHKHKQTDLIQDMEELLRVSCPDTTPQAICKDSPSTGGTPRRKADNMSDKVEVESNPGGGSGQMDEENQYHSELRTVLQLLCGCQETAFMDDKRSAGVLLTLVHWALTMVHTNFTEDVDIQLNIVTWICDSCVKATKDFPILLLSDSRNCQTVCRLLLAMFSSGSKDSDHSSKTYLLNEQLNKIFLYLLETLENDQTFSKHHVVLLLAHKSYQQLVQKLKASAKDVPQSAVTSLVKSLWLGVTRPIHAEAILGKV